MTSGSPVRHGTKGYIVIRRPWPGMLLSLWGDEEKYKQTYWSKFPGLYYPGDYALVDEDGYLWLLGRADDGTEGGRSPARHDGARERICLTQGHCRRQQ